MLKSGQGCKGTWDKIEIFEVLAWELELYTYLAIESCGVVAVPENIEQIWITAFCCRVMDPYNFWVTCSHRADAQLWEPRLQLMLCTLLWDLHILRYNDKGRYKRSSQEARKEQTWWRCSWQVLPLYRKINYLWLFNTYSNHISWSWLSFNDEHIKPCSVSAMLDRISAYWRSPIDFLHNTLH